MHMDALNRAFEKAFLHSENDDSISELLSCMGEELGCERISIFEENEDGYCDNTYEWCRPDVVREQLVLQHVAIAKFDSWHDRLANHETIVICSPEEIKDSDPDVYNMFIAEDIHSAIVTLLAFHGVNFGFCILEDPSDTVMRDKDLVMPGIRYILSSLIYSRNLVSRLRRLGYIDSLTGAGNRVLLRERIEAIDYDDPIGVISVDLIGWDNAEGKALHLEREQTLLRAGEILVNLFDDEHVFRVTTGEFIIIANDPDEASFDLLVLNVKGLFREHNLLASVAGEWRGRLDPHPGAVDELIHDVHVRCEEEKRLIAAHRTKPHQAVRTKDEDEASISIPKGDEFFRIADDFLANLFEGSVVAIVTDINYFKLYNDIFGRHAGNAFLENIARIVSDAAQRFGGICGYIGGDNFCLIAPARNRSNAEIEAAIEEIYAMIEFPEGFSPAMGAYLSEDRRETVITLYDRALNALSEIKGDYIEHIRFYSAEKHQHQREDKMLLMNVKEGLSNGEFVFYVQPQVHEQSGLIIGGEALVRWLHDGQLIPPGNFIPMLEKTGYVYTVDSHVWESVAKWQRSLIDRGITPVPISVNVSKVDFYFDDIAQHFIDLVERYDLEPKLIGVEITESAFTDNMDTIAEAVSRLHEAGFYILMDDFGSGSSSLSMLHEMSLDVLKTDVRFMSKDTRDKRAISIVESVVSMAHLIGMSVVTEGVETEEQKENLIALGDSFAQGFLFHRPMPPEEFEKLIEDPENVTDGYGGRFEKSLGNLRFRDMIKEGLVSDTLLESILRAAAIYKVEGDDVSIVQLNDEYAQMVGISAVEAESIRLAQFMHPDEFAKLLDLFEQAGEHLLGGSEGAVRFGGGNDGAGDEFEMRVFLLYTLDDHSLYLSTMERSHAA